MATTSSADPTWDGARRGAAQAAWQALDVIETYIRAADHAPATTEAASAALQLRAALRVMEQEAGDG